MKSNGHNQLLLPGVITLSRLPDGTAIARVHEISEWFTTREAARRASVCEDTITAKCEDGTLTWRWKNFEGAGGSRLILAQSLQMHIDQKIRLGRLHPQFAFA